MQKGMNSCLGCGAALQTQNIEATGYVKNLDQPFCMNCYKLMHYGKSEGHFHPDNLPTFNKNSLIIIVSSVLYLDTLLSSEVKRLGDTYEITYLVNQIDLLPESTSKNYLLGKIQKRFNENRVLYEDIVLMSAKNPYDIKNLKEYITESGKKSVYLIGLQNSGKTTIFKELTGNKEALAMSKAALTQTILKDSFNDIMIYDTPGLYQKGYLHEFLDYQDYKNLLPQKTFKPRNGRLMKNDSIIIEGLVAVSILKGETTSVLFASDYIKHHLTTDDKVLSLLNNQNIFKYNLGDYKFYEFSLKEDKKYQLTLADFGIMTFTGPVTIRVYANPNMHISVYESFLR